MKNKFRYDMNAFDAADEYFKNRKIDETIVPKSELKYTVTRVEENSELFDYYKFYGANEITRHLLDSRKRDGYELFYNPVNGKFFFRLSQASLDEIEKFREEGRERERQEIKLTQELEKAFGCDIETIYHKLKNVYKETGLELPFDDEDEEIEEEVYEENEVAEEYPTGIVTSTENYHRTGSHHSFFSKNTGRCEILHVRQRED